MTHPTYYTSISLWYEPRFQKNFLSFLTHRVVVGPRSLVRLCQAVGDDENSAVGQHHVKCPQRVEFDQLGDATARQDLDGLIHAAALCPDKTLGLGTKVCELLRRQIPANVPLSG